MLVSVTVADVDVEVMVVSTPAGKAKADDAAMPRTMTGREIFIVREWNSYQDWKCLECRVAKLKMKKEMLLE